MLLNILSGLFDDVGLAVFCFQALASAFVPNPFSGFLFNFLILQQPEDIGRLHGPNERISRQSLSEVVNFYAHLFDNLQNFDAAGFRHHTDAEL